MVISTGLEPVTPRLGIWCSIQMSYETTSQLIYILEGFRYQWNVTQKGYFYTHILCQICPMLFLDKITPYDILFLLNKNTEVDGNYIRNLALYLDELQSILV